MFDNTCEEFRDYHYIIDDLSRLAIGARYSYAELAENIDLSYKFRCIIKRYLEQEVDPATTIEGHFYCMDPESESCRIYQQLRTRVHCYVRKEHKGLLGSRSAYAEAIYSAEELAAMSAADKQNQGLMIAEIEIPKLRLTNFAM